MGTPLGALPDVTPAKLGYQAPRHPSRSAPRARCNRSWRGPTAPPGAGTEASFKMKDCHALMPLLLIVSTPFHKVKRE